MHVLLIPSWYPEHPGDFTGSFFAEQAEALVHAGHTVGVLAVSGTPSYHPGRIRERPRGPRSSVENGVAVLRKHIVVPLPLLHTINQRAWNAAWQSLYRAYVDEFGIPDVLHAHSMFPGGLAAAALSRRSGVPYVITEHRPSSMARLTEPGMRTLARRAARGAGARVAVARGFVSELDTAYGLPGAWQYVPGLLSPQFEHVAPRSMPPGPFTVGHVSHLDPGKRVSLLIEAFSDAFSDGDERLRVAGDSVHRPGLEDVARREGIADRVDFVGAVPRADIAAEFARHHVFALPSEAEAFGTVLWEAMACGIPVVSTQTWAGRNAISDRTGLLVPIDDRAALAAALRSIRDSINAFDAGEIRALCLAHCGEAAFVSQYTEIYRRAVVESEGNA